MSIGEHFICFLLAMWLLCYLVFKLGTVVDDDGSLKKRTNEGIASWIERMFK